MEEFIEKFAEAIEIDDASTLMPETLFRNLEEWNSLSMLSLIAMYDDEYGKEVGVQLIRNCNTVEDLYNLTK